MDERVIDAMRPYLSEKFFNPSSPYAPAVYVRRDYEDAKHRIAMCIGGKANDIVITAGATESINVMFASVTGHVVTSSIEHHAVLRAAQQHDHTLVEPDNKGSIHADTVQKAIRPDTVLVSIQLANNELGTIQPIRDIAEVVKQERQRRDEAGEMTPIYFHSDASQGVGQIDLHIARLGVDALTINAAKIYGPKQVACLWVDRFVKLSPLIVGGGQERGLRSGTENVAGVVGFARALELAVQHHHSEADRLRELRDRMQAALSSSFPEMVVSGNQKKRLPGHLHVSFPGIDAERLIFALETRGLLAATGSACAANKGMRSHVLSAIGLAPEVADGSLRLTLGRLTTGDIVDQAIEILTATLRDEMKRVSR